MIHVYVQAFIVQNYSYISNLFLHLKKTHFGMHTILKDVIHELSAISLVHI